MKIPCLQHLFHSFIYHTGSGGPGHAAHIRKELEYLSLTTLSHAVVDNTALLYITNIVIIHSLVHNP